MAKPEVFNVLFESGGIVVRVTEIVTRDRRFLIMFELHKRCRVDETGGRIAVEDRGRLTHG